MRTVSKTQAAAKGIGIALLVYVILLIIGEAALYGVTNGEWFLSEETRSLLGADPAVQTDTASAVMLWYLLSVLIGWLVAVVFLVLTSLKSPANARDEESLKPVWFLLLVLSLFATGGYAWYAFAASSLILDLNGAFAVLGISLGNLLMLIAYYLATVLGVPHKMGPSVPGRHWFVRLTK